MGKATALLPMSAGETQLDVQNLALDGPVQFSPPARAVLGVVQIATDLVMDIEGALLIAQLDLVEIRFTKIAFEEEQICSETYMKAYESGAISTAISSLSLPALHPQTGLPYVTQWGISCT